MKKIILLLVMFCQAVALLAQDMPLDEFVKFFRRRANETTYAMLDGVLQHRRKGEELVSMPIYCGLIIGPERTNGQLILNDHDACLFGQSYRNGGETIIVQNGSLEAMNNVGVQVTDLSLGFLFYPVTGELEKTRLSMYVDCRVIVFQPENSQTRIVAYISEAYGFPIKAEWYDQGAETPYRTLECSDFAKDGDLYYVKRIQSSGPGWRTRIDFEKAEVGIFDKSNPVNIVRKVKQGE